MHSPTCLAVAPIRGGLLKYKLSLLPKTNIALRLLTRLDLAADRGASTLRLATFEVSLALAQR
jgi:hypothetical protein